MAALGSQHSRALGCDLRGARKRVSTSRASRPAPHWGLPLKASAKRWGFHFAGTFDMSNLASLNSASSSALLTVNTSSFARINLQARC